MANRVLPALAAVLAMTVSTVPSVSLAQSAGIAFSETNTDPDAPIEVTSNSLTVDRETGNAIFTGDVFAVQGDLTLNADEVTVIYAEDVEDPDDDGIEEIIAVGNVIIVNGPDVAESNHAVYVPDTNEITMTGDVLLTQERTIIAGDRLVADLETGQGTMTGRVKTTLTPRNKSEASK